VGRTRPQGMSSKAVDDEDQRSMSSLMRKRGRRGPRARRTSIRRVPESRSCSIGPGNRVPPNRSSPPCPGRCQRSSAATHAWNGTSTIRRNDSDPSADPVRYRDILAARKPRNVPPLRRGAGHPPSLDRPAAARPWRTAEMQLQFPLRLTAYPGVSIQAISRI
jgi:hypothetical protein